jgi:TRAP-type C4-dicarboxylate transport system permease small subunit
MLRKLLDNGVEWSCLLLMALLSVDLLLGVFSRYVLFRTFVWYDEIARASFVWLVFLGAAVGVKRGSHFGLHLFVDMLPQSIRGLAAAITPILIGIFAAVLLVQGLAFVELGRYQQLPVMGISKVWVYAAMPVGGLLMLAYSIPQLWRAIGELGK